MTISLCLIHSRTKWYSVEIWFVFLWNPWFFVSNIADVLSTFNAMSFSTFGIMAKPNNSRWIQMTYKVSCGTSDIFGFHISTLCNWVCFLLDHETAPLLSKKIYSDIDLESSRSYENDVSVYACTVRSPPPW